MSEIIADPSNCFVTVRSKEFQGKTDQEEYYYKTPYSKGSIHENGLFEKLKNPQVPDGEMGMPPHNNLFPSNFDLLAKDEQFSKAPLLLRNSEGIDLWYEKDDKFEKPKAVFNLKYYTSDLGLGSSLQGRVFAELWDGVLREYTNEFQYMADLANLKFSFSLL
jgi:secreted Zn-dependent insulinase-like peptidase